MISLPFSRPRQAPSIDALYGMIVAQARRRTFYLGYGVPDTIAARLDMIMLHLVLLLRQVAKEQGNAQGVATPAGQQLFDRFCQDIDDNFREMGVGDLTVPKEMRRVAEAFYGRAKAYESALADDNAAALEAAVARNVFGVTEPPLGARRLAAYMREASRRLGEQEPVALARAELEFPDPEATAAPSLQGRPNP
jgi:cytochrome b pre-mRNA-processing protein 3